MNKEMNKLCNWLLNEHIEHQYNNSQLIICYNKKKLFTVVESINFLTIKNYITKEKIIDSNFEFAMLKIKQEILWQKNIG